MQTTLSTQSVCADTKEALKKRLEEFRNQTTAVLEHYRAFGVVKTVQADGSIPKVSRLEAESTVQSHG